MKPKILVVEDEETLRRAIVRALRRETHDVLEASSGEEGWAVYQENPCQIAFLDIVLGGMSGLQLLEKIRSADKDVVGVVMTSYGSIEAVKRAMRAGAYDFLTKPFEDLEIIRVVARRAQERWSLVAHNRDLTDQLSVQTRRLAQWEEKLSRADIARDYHETLSAELARCRETDRALSVVILAVDGLDTVAATRGQDTAERLMGRLEQSVRSRLKPWESLARCAIDRLHLVLPEVAAAEASTQIERLLAELEPELPDPTKDESPASLASGIAAYPEDGATAAELLNHANGHLSPATEPA